MVEIGLKANHCFAKFTRISAAGVMGLRDSNLHEQGQPFVAVLDGRSIC